MFDPRTHQVAVQRMRNRIIDALLTASSFDEQRESQEAVFYECISRWILTEYEDCAGEVAAEDLGPPIFTPEELEAMARFEKVWEKVNAWLPEPPPPLAELYDKPEWQLLADAATEAHGIFMRRGRMDNQVDEVFD